MYTAAVRWGDHVPVEFDPEGRFVKFVNKGGNLNSDSFTGNTGTMRFLMAADSEGDTQFCPVAFIRQFMESTAELLPSSNPGPSRSDPLLP